MGAIRVLFANLRQNSSLLKKLVVAVANVLTVLLVLRTVQSARQASILTAADYNHDVEERVDDWLASARCAQQTGIWLAICTDHGALPIEDRALADDRGHALLLSAWARLTDRTLTREDLTTLNLWINAVGMEALALTLLACGFPISALGCLFFALTKVVPGPLPGPDVVSAYLGVTALACASLVWAVSSQFLCPCRSRWWTALLATTLSLGAALLLRQAIGMIGLTGALGVCIVRAWRDKHTVSRWASMRLGVAGLLWLGTLTWTPALLALRNHVWHLAPSLQVATHGFSHTLFVGLGSVPNPWGIEESDVYGLHLAQRLDPSAGYTTPAYYRLMRHLYWNLVLHHPFKVLGVYAAKVRKISQFPFRWMGVNVLVGAAICLVGFVYGVWRAPRVASSPIGLGLTLELFFALFLLQGVLGIPWMKHLYPLKFLLILMVSAGLDSLVAAARNEGPRER